MHFYFQYLSSEGDVEIQNKDLQFRIYTFSFEEVGSVFGMCGMDKSQIQAPVILQSY